MTKLQHLTGSEKNDLVFEFGRRLGQDVAMLTPGTVDFVKKFNGLDGFAIVHVSEGFKGKNHGDDSTNGEIIFRVMPPWFDMVINQIGGVKKNCPRVTAVSMKFTEGDRYEFIIEFTPNRIHLTLEDMFQFFRTMQERGNDRY